jgi:hypothetical protein
MKLITLTQGYCAMVDDADYERVTRHKWRVHWRKDSHVWRAFIRVDNKRVSLGQFASAKDAALAYNKAALHYFGEFAAKRLLVPPSVTNTSASMAKKAA